MTSSFKPVVATLLAAGLVSCAEVTGSGSFWADTADCPQAADFLDVSGAAPAGVPAAPALSVWCDGDAVIVHSNGIPNFDFDQVTPNSLSEQDHEWVLPREPVMASRTTDIPLGGASAVAVNGLPIFGPTEAPFHGYRDPYLDNMLDYCNGHTAPGGVYHFHARPDCLFENAAGQTGLVIGYAFDGIPILAPWICEDDTCEEVTHLSSGYRQVEANYGATIENAWDAHTYDPNASPLDACNGMTLADGRYAYFATDTFPYLMGCYVGEVEGDNMAGGGF
ncbi:MAG: YHYH protein [Alphaproteobacteria bacterium]|nr:YHYH protein [Alphaproteobacteria bacterium]